MHRDMRVELEGGRIGRDQAAFDQWKEQYNHERPYEALQMKTPGEIYRKSKRKWRGTPEDLDYGSMSHRRVHRCGWISYKHEYYQLSTALGGWSVGLKPQADGLVEVWFGEQALGWIDPATSSFKSLQVSENKTGQAMV